MNELHLISGFKKSHDQSSYRLLNVLAHLDPSGIWKMTAQIDFFSLRRHF